MQAIFDFTMANLTIQIVFVYGIHEYLFNFNLKSIVKIEVDITVLRGKWTMQK